MPPLQQNQQQQQQQQQQNQQQRTFSSCPNPQSCFLCISQEPDPSCRHAALSCFFKQIAAPSNGHDMATSSSHHHHHHQEHQHQHQHHHKGHDLASSMHAMWTSAMSRPDDPDLVDLGIFRCMASLITKGLRSRRWLLKNHNIYIPYYAAHIIGSYTMTRPDFAAKAVSQGVIPPLVELLRGRLTWVEQRVAVRAIGHIAAFESTFPSVAMQGEVLELAIELALNSLEIVYTQFIQSEDRRLKYHVDLLTRGGSRSSGGLKGGHIEARKGEEWASQLQCWALQLINCFAMKEKYLPIVCRPDFLAKLPGMWGGLVNEKSPAGIGLLLTICRHKIGRSYVAGSPDIIQPLCNTARSSDDWQYMAVDCLLLLLQDSHTRRWIFDLAVVPLADLAVQPCQRERKKLGAFIVDLLLHQDFQSPMRPRMSSQTRYALQELASQRQRWKWEKSMSKSDLRVKQQAAHVVKLEGNAKFTEGDVGAAVYKYSEALSLCPLRATRERVVLYSNRAQCHLLLQDPEAAISDTTRALCLHKPMNGHGRSLWRRSQAYEMMGLAKESLLDAIMFVNECSSNAGEGVPVPDYAERLVQKQMRETWLFLEAARRHGDLQEMQRGYAEAKDENEEEEDDGDDDDDADEDEDEDEEDCEGSEWETLSESDMTLIDDTTDQGSCSRDEVESDHQPQKERLDNNLQQIWSSFKGMQLRKSSNDRSPWIEQNEKEPASNKLPVDKDLLKKQIYSLIQERRLLNHREESGKEATKGS